MERVAIIGGGISGLSAAFYLEQARRGGAAVEYALYEASGRLGGVLRTEHVDGFVIEAGPDSFLTEKPAAAELARELGIEDQLIGSNDAARKTFILVDGRLVAMPDGLQFGIPTKILPALTTPLFSFDTKVKMVQEYFRKPQAQGQSDEDTKDISVAEFFERHFGREVVERMADPLMAGVYGGEASKLSMRAVLPRFLEMEAKHGSLSRALMANRRNHSGPPRSIFSSFRQGMQQLTDSLVQRLPAERMRLNSRIVEVRRLSDTWHLVFAGGRIAEFNSLIFGIPANAAACLLRPFDSGLADQLSGIRYSSSMTVALAYSADKLGPAAREINGFGFLVPRREGKRMIACTFVHNKFAGRAPAGQVLLRAFLGGTTDEAAVELDDEAAIDVVRRELGAILGLSAVPALARVARWPQAMAQYEIGHLNRLAAIEQRVAALPGIQLIGNAYRGIGIPDCVRSGREAAQRVATPAAQSKNL